MNAMTRVPSQVTGRARLPVLFAAAAACVLFCGPALAAEPQAGKKSPAPAQQRSFDTPKAAAEALVAAADPFDVDALKAIFGPAGADLIATDDPVQDRNQLSEFATRAREKSTIVPDAKNPDLARLWVGDQDWPMPIPIVRKDGKWSFDAKAGRKEILYRRVGRNELDAIELCRTFVSAQHEYALEKRDGSQVNQYAQRNISAPGKQDGLAWQNPDGTWGGPLGERVAGAIAEGYGGTGKPAPYHGYLFKVLKGQGPAAHLGEMDFVVKGAMIGGFALVAAPAEYGVTGVKTFMVSHDGVVYEKDLGPKSVESFRKMERFNPGKGWRPVEVP